jgi:D-alanyl-D-alanine carboxypeptidase
LKASIEVSNIAVAPVRRGDRLGNAKVAFNDAIIAERDLVALQDVGVGGIFRRLIDQIQLWIRK